MKITIEPDLDHQSRGSAISLQLKDGTVTMTSTRFAYGVSWLVKESIVHVDRSETEAILRDAFETFLKGVKT